MFVLALFEGDEVETIGNYRREHGEEENQKPESAGLCVFGFFGFLSVLVSGFLDGDDADFFFDEVSVIQQFSQSEGKKKKKKEEKRGKVEQKQSDSGL